MRFIAPLLVALLVAVFVRADELPPPTAALATVDLGSAEDVSAIHGTWRYADATLQPVQFRGPDADGQPTGPPTHTYSVVPKAGAPEFDDSTWPAISPDAISQRRGPGRISFGWYRFTFTTPDRLKGIETHGQMLVFQVGVDDYAEVWVDGELARPFGAAGAQVVAGWNAANRLLITRRAHPGERHEIAVFAMNGPISDSPANYIFVREAYLELHSAGPAPVAVTPQEVNVEVKRLDPALDAIVPVNTKLFKLAEGFSFTEGPVWSRADESLFFSDPNDNRMYRYSEAGELSVYRERSGYNAPDIGEYTQPGSNGLTFDRQGRLVINEHGRHRVSRLEANGRLTVLAESYRGKRLNSPNDLVVKSDGAVYFTDPPFGLPRFYDDPRKELPFSGVFRWRSGRLTLLTTELKGPNGLAFTPDERFLYVDNWDPAYKVVLRFPVRSDGTLGPSTIFADMTAELPGEEALDGLKVDVAGNLYVAAPDGVRIYSAAGKHLGTVRGPKTAHNLAWGDADGRTLYLTALSGLYRLPLLVRGVRP